MLRLLLILLILLIHLNLTLAAQEPTKGIDLALIASVNSIAPSSTFTIGLTIRHHPGYHTYWKNPGAVGYPTRIKWDLPKGFTAGEIQWPYPETSKMANHPIYGYERDITLLIHITAPPHLPAQKINLHANISWMACSDSCHPDNRRLTITLPTSKKTHPNPKTKTHLANAKNQIPKPLENWHAQIQTPQNSQTITILLTPPPNQPQPEQLTFYSTDGQISSQPAPKITKLKNHQYQITANRAQYSPKNTPTLPFILTSPNPISPNQQKFGKLNPTYPNK